MLSDIIDSQCSEEIVSKIREDIVKWWLMAVLFIMSSMALGFSLFLLSLMWDSI